MMHSDSVSSAFDRRMAFSRMRDRITSALVGLDHLLARMILHIDKLRFDD